MVEEEYSLFLETHCSGARRARIAVCGSFKDLPSFENGMWVSPVWLLNERRPVSHYQIASLQKNSNDYSTNLIRVKG